jgi:serine/threonine-protein kinase
MTGDAGWNRIKTLFQAAVELAPEDRSAFLDQACGGDRTLQREIESLLTAHREAGAFAERPAMETLTESPADAHYQILSLLGAGAMGEVYRARDAVLGRDVAIKILPPIFALDPERLARFDREAHLLASLNHPNICAIHGLANINGAPGLVLELVEGTTLKDRLEGVGASARRSRRGRKTSSDAQTPALSLKEALTIGRDIAGALEAAHERSISHRDLKPANIKITLEGVVKVLDFGLAKASAEIATPHDRNQAVGASESQDGIVIGTAAYMSPEQARAEPTDKRTDIWSFGCVLYEMLTGSRAANGATVSETIAAVLESEPDWTALSTAPPNVQRLVRRCLEQDARRRLKDIGDARLELEDALLAASDATASGNLRVGVQAPESRHAWRWLFAAALVLGTGVSLVWLREPPRASSPELRRVSVELGTDASLVTFQLGQGSAAILSPDGSRLAFVAQIAEGAARQIYLRRLDELRAAPIRGTDGALNPFFSPDGRWIAFFADGKLKKVPTAGGGAVTICTALNNRGGAWGEDGTIAFSPDRSGAPLWHVSASGGEPSALTTLGEGETTQRWPQMLRGGRAVLFTGNSRPDGFQEANVVVQELPNGPRKVLVRGAYYGRYLSSGHLAYVHNATLFAARFDIDRLELAGPSVPVLEGAAVNLPVGAAEIAFSDGGTVAYLPTPDRVNYMDAGIDWMDRSGKMTPLRTTPVRWLNPRFAGDGRRLAFDLFDGTQYDVWIYDWSLDALTRLTFGSSAAAPVWTPDARRIAFRSRPGHGLAANLYWQRVDGVGEAKRLTTANREHWPGSWHANGRLLAFSEIDPETGVPSIMMLRLDGDEASGWQPSQPTAFLKGADSPMFSPDGRWLAYVPKTSPDAATEVFVRPFPRPGGPWQISSGGGTNPVWSPKRPELFYGTPDHQIMVTSYATSGGSFRAEKPRLLSDARFAPRIVGPSFDVHPDGDRFVLARAADDAMSRRNHVTLIFGFFDQLRRIAP